jgi:hypothetical protein
MHKLGPASFPASCNELMTPLPLAFMKLKHFGSYPSLFACHSWPAEQPAAYDFQN